MRLAILAALASGLSAQTLTSVSPTTILIGSTVTLNVFGSNFRDGATVLLNDQKLVTKFRASYWLTADVPADLQVTGNAGLTVVNPASATINIAMDRALTVKPVLSVISQVAGGPIARIPSLDISTKWAATATAADGAPWLIMNPPAGEAVNPLGLGLVDWRASGMPAGTYTATVRIAAANSTQTKDVPLTWKVAPARPDPVVRYAGNMQNCIREPNYGDADLCNPAPDGFTPAVGLTYTDQTFGASVRILTTPGAYHAYSSPNPLSANNKHLLVFKDSGFFDVVLVADGSVISANVNANQSAWWDPESDDRYYFTSNSTVVAHSVSLKTDTVLIDYAPQMTNLERGGTGDSSKDGWISFFDRTATKVCALDVAGKKTYCADFTKADGPAIPRIDFSLISKGRDVVSGKRYVILAGAPENKVYTVNETTGVLDFGYRGPQLPDRPPSWYLSHADTVEANGLQYVVFNDYTNNPCVFGIYSLQLNKGSNIYRQVEIGGGWLRAFDLWRCGSPGWVDEHVGCSKKSPVCVISTQSDARSSTDVTPVVHTAHDNELIVFEMTATGYVITRLSKSHTIKWKDQGDQNYWATPRAAVSNDGKLIVFDSNYGTTDKARVSIATYPRP